MNASSLNSNTTDSTVEHDPLRASILSSANPRSMPTNHLDKIEELKRKTDQLRSAAFTSPILKAEQEAILRESAEKMISATLQQPKRNDESNADQKVNSQDSGDDRDKEAQEMMGNNNNNMTSKPRAKIKIPAK